MSDLTLVLLRIGFLVLLWIFVFIVVYALRSDLFGPSITKVPAQSQSQPQPQSAPRAAAPDAQTTMTEKQKPGRQATHDAATRATASRLVITAGPKSGLEMDLPATGITIGRSSGSGLMIRDDYTSNSHARVMLWGDDWMLQDLDSTNGTFLDGQRVLVPTKLALNTPVKIGTTTFELRR